MEPDQDVLRELDREHKFKQWLREWLWFWKGEEIEETKRLKNRQA